jgi:lipase
VDPFRDEIELALDGRTLTVARAGAALGAGAPVILAAHGISSHSRAWSPVARLLGEEVCFLAPDLRGRGRSRELGPPFGLACHARDLAAVLDHVGAGPAIVAGHSMGAFVAGVLALSEPQRVRGLVLVDGGVPADRPEGVSPDEVLDAVLGPAVARLRLTFPSLDAYVDFWREHPAFGDGDVDEADLRAYAERDLVGEAPELRPAVREEAVRADGRELVLDDEARTAASRAGRPAVLLRAPRGLLNEDHPFIPAEEARAFACVPHHRLVDVDDVNHYTITLGAGAGAVARAIREASLG